MPQIWSHGLADALDRFGRLSPRAGDAVSGWGRVAPRVEAGLRIQISHARIAINSCYGEAPAGLHPFCDGPQLAVIFHESRKELKDV